MSPSEDTRHDVDHENTAMPWNIRVTYITTLKYIGSRSYIMGTPSRADGRLALEDRASDCN